MRKFYIPLVCVLLLVGCATLKETTGTPIKSTSLEKIIKGKTTITDLLTWWGPPYRILSYSVLNKQGVKKRYIVYIYEYIIKGTKAFAKGYPIAQERASENKNVLIIWIDKNTGIVENYIYKQGIPVKPSPPEQKDKSEKSKNNSNITY